MVSSSQCVFSSQLVQPSTAACLTNLQMLLGFLRQSSQPLQGRATVPAVEADSLVYVARPIKQASNMTLPPLETTHMLERFGGLPILLLEPYTHTATACGQQRLINDISRFACSICSKACSVLARYADYHWQPLLNDFIACRWIVTFGPHILRSYLSSSLLMFAG